MDNVLDPLDQAMFEFDRATGVKVLIQGAWVYNGAIDVDGLRQFYDRLQRGRLSRRVERSPLRFGRHRWISPNGSSRLEIAESARPREEFDTWLCEQADTPLDCERGPVWHLAVLPFTDGGVGASIVVPHCLTDGLALTEALAEAAFGHDDPVSWPDGATRRRGRAVRQDARQTMRDAGAIGRAVAAAVRSARQSRAGAALRSHKESLTATGADEPFAVPIATMLIDADEWEARAKSLGGTSNALLVGLTARLAEQRGRVTTDGSVVVRMPYNERTTGDTRGNAVSNIDVAVDPTSATTDLRIIRAAVKEALARHQEVPDFERAMLSLVPLIPKRLLKRISGNGTGVISTHLGAINPAATRLDGTNADHFAMKLHYAGVTEEMMHQFGGLQIVASGRVDGEVFVTVHAYQPGQPNSEDGLRQELSRALKEFSITGTHL
ncbi:MAG: hypothetical protein K2X52_29315 [Mycobacteriaceae bacterium]|nr:hypothetical protein [Mycobacteriaceae bacterium]